MAEANVIAKVPKVNFFLNISNISTLDEIWSPEYLVQGLPWQVAVRKEVTGGKANLALYLYCVKRNKTQNWSYVASATFKLMPFNDHVNSVEFYAGPHVFDDRNLGYGDNSLFAWDDLIDAAKGYVQNDAINLEISIEAADAGENAKSKLRVESVESGCESGCMQKFRLSATNIRNLMAVRSPTFQLRNLPWTLTVFKSRSSMLSVRLGSETTGQKVSLTVEARVKLISSKGDEKTIKIIQDKSYDSSSEIFELQVASWDDVCEPENGFVNNDSINMKVKIKMRVKQNHDQEPTSTKRASKLRRTEFID